MRWQFWKASEEESAAEPTTPPRDQVGGLPYWQLLLELTRAQQARDIESLGRLQTVAGVLIAGVGALGVARVQVGGSLAWFDWIFLAAAGVALGAALWVVWPIKRPFTNHDIVRRKLEAEIPRDAVMLAGAIYQSMHGTNEKARKKTNRLYILMRIAIVAFAVAVALLFAPFLTESMDPSSGVKRGL